MDFIEQIKRYVSLGQFDAIQMDNILREFQRRELLANTFDGGNVKEFADKVFHWFKDNIEPMDLNIDIGLQYETLTKKTENGEIRYNYQYGFYIGLTNGDYLIQFTKDSRHPGGDVSLSVAYDDEEGIWMGLNDEQLNDPAFFDEAMKNFLDNLAKISTDNYPFSELGIFNYRSVNVWEQR